jgi:hypothetical protein
MYDVSNPTAPVLVDRVWLGGSITRGSGVTVSPESLAALGLTEQPEAAVVQGVKLQGGPQMLQLRWAAGRGYCWVVGSRLEQQLGFAGVSPCLSCVVQV